ncbi:MAG: TerC family protein [Gammaproteobacteria bacterium]
MEFSADWLARLAAIIFVDLVLAGDNAVVIALAARNLPKHLQKKAVYAGTAGAIVVRVVLVVFALQLLRLPGLSLAGGLLLYYVAWRLIANDDSARAPSAVADSFWTAMRTIIIADTVMGLDNILAIAGASGGDLGLVIFGFLLSIPIMVGGSMLILRLMEKAPWLITVGGALLAAIAGRMILDDIWTRAHWPQEWGAMTEWAAILAAAAVFTATSAMICARRQNGG